MPDRHLTAGPFAVDTVAQLVLREGEPLSLGARATRLLEALLRRPGEVITKAELLDAAWPGTAVEESNLSVQIAALRRALAEVTGGREWIATVPRVGYRFVGPSDPQPTGGLSSDRRPAIAVLPFTNLSSDPEQAFFADGLAEEILTALSRFPALTVIGRNSSFVYRGDGVDLRKVGADLDVQYLVTGSVRRSGVRLRMAVQLIDADKGVQLWAETYDRELTDVFAVQDDITRQVVRALGSRLPAGPPVPSGSAGTRDLEALELYLRGRGILSAPDQSPTTSAEGIALLHRALEADPTFPDAYAMLAIAHVTERSSNWTADPAMTLAAARRAADAGVRLAPADGDILASSALVSMLEKDNDRLGRETERALHLTPMGSVANLLRGAFLVADGRAMEAVPHIERAIRVDPGMTHLYIHHLGTAYLLARRHETAAALFRARIVLSPNTDMSRAYLCIALGHLAEHDEARRVWAELAAINPGFSLAERLDWWAYRRPEDPEHLLDGLRKAGLPTGRADESLAT